MHKVFGNWAGHVAHLKPEAKDDLKLFELELEKELLKPTPEIDGTTAPEPLFPITDFESLHEKTVRAVEKIEKGKI